MHIREARVDDIQDIVRVRASVRENVLSRQISHETIVDYLTKRGRGWVVLDGDLVVGFSVADLQDPSIWALFLLPEYEGRGLGKALLQTAVKWLWSNGCETIWLTTESGTRAEGFYSRNGWSRVGPVPNNEILFELRR